jgi:hypothetical protein
MTAKHDLEAIHARAARLAERTRRLGYAIQSRFGTAGEHRAKLVHLAARMTRLDTIVEDFAPCFLPVKPEPAWSGRYEPKWNGAGYYSGD